LFGGAPSTSTSTATAPPPKPSAGSSNLNPNNQATKTVTLGEQAPSFVKGKTFNEIVERFEQELGTQVKTFKDQAAEVREWDLVLMQNASSVSPRHTNLTLGYARVECDLFSCTDRWSILGHATG
jgi:nuclear pore complex protein Nup62